MKAQNPERSSPPSAATPPDVRHHLATVTRTVSGIIKTGRTTVTSLLEQVPGTVRATRAGAHSTTTTLQSLPDTTLRGLAASSVGLGAGFYVAGFPRLVIAAGVAPAVIMGAAIVLRPIEPIRAPAASP